MEREALKRALEALEEAWYHVGTFQPTEKAIDLYDKARTVIKEALAQPAQEPERDMPHGWVVNWPSPNGGTKPVYHASAIKPKFGEELDGKLTMYPVFTRTAPPQREWNAALDEAAARIGEIKGFGQATQDSFAVYIKGLKK